MTPNQNNANKQNANKGTKGTNLQYDKAQGHRGKQIQANKEGSKSRGKGGNKR